MFFLSNPFHVKCLLPLSFFGISKYIKDLTAIVRMSDVFAVSVFHVNSARDIPEITVKLVDKKIGMNEAETELIKYSSPMHDIGKVGIPDNILLKPGKLTTEEFKIMKTHSDIGSKVLAGSDSEILKTAEEIAETHHEKFDGTGYPFCLKGKNIPLFGRITAIADVFDALTSARDYQKYTETETMSHAPMPLPKVLQILKTGAGKEFDPAVVAAFLNCMVDALLKYRGEHFPPAYVDETIEILRKA